MNLSRRGQLSIFLILAAVLLIVAGVTWYLVRDTNSGVEEPLGAQTDAQQVQTFITNCLTDSARESLFAAARNAGFVNPAALGYSALPPIPTEARALDPFETGDPLPYWSYLASSNQCTNCRSGSEQPPLTGAFPSVEAQLSSAITESFIACVNNFDSFASLNVEPLATPRVAITFGESDTTVALVYPVRVTGGNTESTPAETYSARLAIPFRKLYTIAYDIRLQAEATDFFEGMTLEAITYEAVDNSIPPPAGSLDVGYDPGPIWALSDVQTTLTDVLVRNVNIVQLFGARNMDFVNTGDSTTDRMYANYYLSISTVPDDVDASFVYLPEWAPYVRVSPGGQVIRPERLPSLPLLPQFKQSNFQYDVSYPVLVQLSTDTEYGPFLFQFPIEVNMRTNRALNARESLALGEEAGLCAPENAIGSTARVTLAEATTGATMDANVRYSCVDESCYYGESSGGVLETTLPPCIAGELVAERDGFQTARMRFDSVGNEARQVQLQLTRLTDVSVNVAATPLLRAFRNGDDLGPFVPSGSVALEPGQRAIVTLAPLSDPDFTQIIVFPPGENQPPTVALAPGEYSVTALLLEDLTQPHVVRGKEVCGGSVLGIGGTCETIPDITFGDGESITLDDGTTVEAPAGVMYLGGVTLDETTHTVYITQAMLDQGAITVPIVYVPRSQLQIIDDLEVLGSFDDYTGNFFVE
jgi:hypothetical protein